MLNKHGQADLWFGVSPGGKPVGMTVTDKTLRDVSQALAAHITEVRFRFFHFFRSKLSNGR